MFIVDFLALRDRPEESLSQELQTMTVSVKDHDSHHGSPSGANVSLSSEELFDEASSDTCGSMMSHDNSIDSVSATTSDIERRVYSRNLIEVVTVFKIFREC